jgi:hypothetical protein
MATDRYSDNHTISVSGGSGTLTVDGDLAVTGSVEIDSIDAGGSTLNITGDVSVDGSLDVSENTTISGNLSVAQNITASSVESASFVRSSTVTRKIWIPAIFFSYSGATRAYSYSPVENYSDGGETGSSLFARAESVTIDGLVELFISLNQFLNEKDSITEIEIVGAADSSNHVIHYTLESDRYNGSARTISQSILDSDNANIIRTLDTKSLYIKTLSSGNFSHTIYPIADISASGIFSGRAYIFRIFSEKATYGGTGSCDFDGIYITIETNSPI